MTRETKIGLLVGLAFIIVIGILLSDHFHGTTESQPATLDRAGSSARQAVNVPGSNLPNPVVSVVPDEVSPHGPVQTQRDIQPSPSPVVLAPPTTPPPAPGTDASDPLVATAHQHGEEIVAVDSNNGSAAQRTYRAVAGDTVSRMAARLLGANTHQNRQLIIQANASLQENPDKVIVGQAYMIPGITTASTEMSRAIPSTEVQVSSSQWVYTVKPGDTLWGIATGQLNNAGAIEAIKEINQTILRGGSTLRPGMKLRMPSAPVAIAD
jgi:nucleoid-associated protein YgaU